MNQASGGGTPGAAADIIKLSNSIVEINAVIRRLRAAGLTVTVIVGRDGLLAASVLRKDPRA